jgi:hypothetical protein
MELREIEYKRVFVSRINNICRCLLDVTANNRKHCYAHEYFLKERLAKKEKSEGKKRKNERQMILC